MFYPAWYTCGCPECVLPRKLPWFCGRGWLVDLQYFGVGSSTSWREDAYFSKAYAEASMPPRDRKGANSCWLCRAVAIRGSSALNCEAFLGKKDTKQTKNSKTIRRESHSEDVFEGRAGKTKGHIKGYQKGKEHHTDPLAIFGPNRVRFAEFRSQVGASLYQGPTSSRAPTGTSCPEPRWGDGGGGGARR